MITVEPPVFPVLHTLADDDVAAARDFAARVTAARSRSADHYLNRRESKGQVDEQAFGAELAAHRVTGLPLHWELLARVDRKQPDIGTRTDVKWTRWNAGHLIFRVDRWEQPLDEMRFVFLLATGQLPAYTLWGWMEGADLYTPHHRRLDRFGSVNRIGYWASRQELDRSSLPVDA